MSGGAGYSLPWYIHAPARVFNGVVHFWSAPQGWQIATREQLTRRFEVRGKKGNRIGVDARGADHE